MLRGDAHTSESMYGTPGRAKHPHIIGFRKHPYFPTNARRYPMLKYLLKTLGQSILLAVGVIIGVLIAPKLERGVQAQQAAAPAQPNGPRIITLQSYSTSGAMGANVLLAHNLQADIAVVNGYDIMKINQQILNYLAQLPSADQRALSAIVANSRAEEIYQLPHQSGPPTPATVPNPNK